jgi:hypothetical protein
VGPLNHVPTLKGLGICAINPFRVQRFIFDFRWRVNPGLKSANAFGVILDEAERWGADLIVVGSHGYRAWERFLLGSVSQAVVSHAKCSVAVVRCRPAESATKDGA